MYRSVDHGILLRKLSKYGFRDNFLNFFSSYLNSRSQFVKIDKAESLHLPISYGVPQGSILGHLLLFLIILLLLHSFIISNFY